MAGPESNFGNYNQQEIDRLVAEKAAKGAGAETAAASAPAESAEEISPLKLDTGIILEGLKEVGLEGTNPNSPEGRKKIQEKNNQLGDDVYGEGYENFRKIADAL